MLPSNGHRSLVEIHDPITHWAGDHPPRPRLAGPAQQAAVTACPVERLVAHRAGLGGADHLLGDSARQLHGDEHAVATALILALRATIPSLSIIVLATAFIQQDSPQARLVGSPRPGLPQLHRDGGGVRRPHDPVQRTLPDLAREPGTEQVGRAEPGQREQLLQRLALPVHLSLGLPRLGMILGPRADPSEHRLDDRGAHAVGIRPSTIGPVVTLEDQQAPEQNQGRLGAPAPATSQQADGQ